MNEKEIMASQYPSGAIELIASQYKCVAELKEHRIFLRILRAKVVKLLLKSKYLCFVEYILSQFFLSLTQGFLFLSEALIVGHRL